MTKNKPKTLMLCAALAMMAVGIAFPAEAKAQTIVVTTAGYQPLYYDGYLVFFDDWGRPYINVGGEIVFVPASFVGYVGFVSHFRMHRARYQAWYRNHGVHLRWYRSPGHRLPRTVSAAPRHSRPGVALRAPQPHKPAAKPRTPSRPGRGNPAQSSGSRGLRR